MQKLVNRGGVAPVDSSRGSGAFLPEGKGKLSPYTRAGGKTPGLGDMRAGLETIEIVKVAQTHASIGGGHRASPMGRRLCA